MDKKTLRANNWKQLGRTDVPRYTVAGAPTPPSNLVASAITDTTCTLTWSAGTAAPGAPITNYRIYKNNTNIAEIGNVLTYNVTGLVANTSYTFKVTAKNSVGNSVYSSPVSVTTTGGAAGVPGAPGSVVATASGTTTIGVTWTAASGTVTGYRVFVDGVQTGADLGSNILSYTITGLAANTAYDITVRAFNANGVGPVSNADTETTWSASAVKFAGHIPNAVIVGMAATASGYPRPTFDEAVSIVAQPVYEQRVFTGSWITSSQLTTWGNNADADGVIPWMSFKPSSTNGFAMEADIANGLMDADLNIIRDFAISRRNAGKGPFFITFHHEPSGDGGSLTNWCNMHIYCSNYFSGIKNGVYNAANDVSDIMAWSSIANGFWWKPNAQGKPAMIAEAYTQTLIDTFRINGSILAADFYDGIPSDVSNHPNSYTFGASQATHRAKAQVQAFIDWARAHNSGQVGCGEFSVADGDIYGVWQVMRDNRDIWSVSNYYNSNTNSTWEWRALPDSYPNYNVQQNVAARLLPDYPGGVEIGGTPVTEQKLNGFRTMLTESKLPQYMVAP